MLGVVLCGGQSLRMGKDKGLLKNEKGTWAERSVQQFTTLRMPFVLSVAQHNRDAYAALFLPSLIVTDDESIAAGGPLKGILSVHKKFPDKDLLLLAVDMQSVTTALLQTLLTEAAHGGAEAFIFQNGGQLEPLLGIYTAKGLSRILHLLQTGALQRWSMHYILQQLNTKIISASATEAPAFANYNTPEDLWHLQ